MGRLRFVAPGREEMLAEFAPRAFMAGLEGIPWVTRCAMHQTQLWVERETHESGMFNIPWRVPGRHEYMLSTSTVMERDQPYHLPLELARGTVNRLRGQMSNWMHVGLQLTPEVEQKAREATTYLAQAATQQHRPEFVTQAADRSCRLALDAIDMLGRLYGDQAIALRLQNGPLGTLLGCRLERVPDSKVMNKALSAFNAVMIPFLWRDIEPDNNQRNWQHYDALVDWARQRNMKICGGPLIQFDRRSLPDWAYLWEDEWEDLHGFAMSHIAAVVNRYKGRIHLWNVAGRVNVPAALQWEEEQMLRLVVDSLEMVKNIDSRIPMVVSFDQPWSEHMGHHDRDLPPLHFADTLARAEMGVAGFGLEINWGYWPHATPERDAIELSRLIDRWTLLGHPLLVSLTAPSAAGPDPLARHAGKPLAVAAKDYPTPQSQALHAQQLLSILAAKSSVQAVFWNQWSDADPHDFPHSGLLDAEAKTKPALKMIAELRRKIQGPPTTSS